MFNPLEMYRFWRASKKFATVRRIPDDEKLPGLQFPRVMSDDELLAQPDGEEMLAKRKEYKKFWDEHYPDRHDSTMATHNWMMSIHGELKMLVGKLAALLLVTIVSFFGLIYLNYLAFEHWLNPMVQSNGYFFYFVIVFAVLIFFNAWCLHKLVNKGIKIYLRCYNRIVNASTIKDLKKAMKEEKEKRERKHH